MTKAWTRWQDWVEVVIGVAVLLSPLVVETSAAAMWTMIVLGALIAVDGFASLANPSMVFGEWFQVVLGALLFISPWVLGYSDLTGASWVSWIGGVLTVVAGAMAMPAANAAHSRLAGTA
ncbi:SPW repeat protein [Saccharothrix australiensis]|uniref:SPW repeat-containing protein n=1 Tax=Saccharothrix australiensis TaxID=2072 RepID=A0A495W7J1_9PSEU|nr:SPW repeat protein [Saccharothrix australiensis]RKT57244.1 SPW repeat-containing protein [Saccharothrix australiensis]